MSDMGFVDGTYKGYEVIKLGGGGCSRKVGTALK